MIVRVNVFAALKDYFESSFDLNLPDGSTIQRLLEFMNQMKPSSKGILDHCRVALNERFVDHAMVIEHQSDLYIIPPSSGG